MYLTIDGIKNHDEWERLGYKLPKYDVNAISEKTLNSPEWIHFGCGNLFRAFQAKAADELLNKGELNRGIIAAEGFDCEITEKILKPHNNLSLLVTLLPDGSAEKSVIGSISASFSMSCEYPDDTGRLKKLFSAPSLKLASFTITEKGYVIYDENSRPYKDVEADFKEGPNSPRSYMGKVAALLLERFKNGAPPIAMVSMDNCAHNGDRLKAALTAFARTWEENGFTGSGFLDYVSNPSRVSFPCTMIDKITPRPDERIARMLEDDGIKLTAPFVTAKNTYAAPFVNAEECRWLVIEDSFPNGRPKLESSGIFFADRETVEKAERMKVCTCLNPLHTALAVFGCLLGYTLISDEMRDNCLTELISRIGYDEGLPVVTDPKIINPEEFLKSVIENRLTNPFIPDSPQRIATDTSQKLAVRFGETIKAYGKDAKKLKYIPLVLAGWVRYLTGIDDRGKPFKISPDPLLERLKEYVADIEIGKEADAEKLKPLLSDKEIFGVDLYEFSLSEKVIEYLNQMLTHHGAVRETIENTVK